MKTLRWDVAEGIPQNLEKEYEGLHPVVAQVLYNRGLKKKKDINSFLNPDYEAQVHDPFLFNDMEKVVERIFTAIKNKEVIGLFCDYDSDGVCSATVLTTVLKDLEATFEIYLPHREKEGYGLNTGAIDYFKEKGVTLMITADCGISNTEEVAYANKKGIEVILTDHHSEPLEIPQAFAIINPKLEKEKYPFKGLAAVGVVFKIATALYQRCDFKTFPPGHEKWLLDLVAIATVGDRMQIVGENRVLVEKGIMVLQKTRRIGLIEMIRKAGLEEKLEKGGFTTADFGFRIVPRINAAGRVEHANGAYALLNSDNHEEAHVMAEELEAQNTQRQLLTKGIVDSAFASIDRKELSHVTVGVGKDWPTGLIGLVASKVLNAFYKPTIIISNNDGKLVGSGRSIEGFNMVEALQQMEELFEHYGGHAMACGFTLKNEEAVDEFKKRMNEIASKELSEEDLTQSIAIDSELGLNELTFEFFNELKKVEPYGDGNLEPVFKFNNAEIVEIRPVGADGSHLKLKLKQEGFSGIMDGIGFGMGKLSNNLHEGDLVDVVGVIIENEWNGSVKLEIQVKDIKKAME